MFLHPKTSTSPFRLSRVVALVICPSLKYAYILTLERWPPLGTPFRESGAAHALARFSVKCKLRERSLDARGEPRALEVTMTAGAPLETLKIREGTRGLPEREREQNFFRLV